MTTPTLQRALQQILFPDGDMANLGCLLSSRAHQKVAADAVIENRYIRATFSGTTNRLAMIENKISGQRVQIDQSLLWYCSTAPEYLLLKTNHSVRYNSSTGNNQASGQPGGAYIFRPNETNPFNISKVDYIQMIQVCGHVLTFAIIFQGNIPAIQVVTGALSSGEEDS